VTLTFDLLTLKVVSESRVTWAISVPILVFLGLSVLELGPLYATDRQTDVRRQTKASLNAQPIRGGGITSCAGGRHNILCSQQVVTSRATQIKSIYPSGYLDL